MKRKSIIRRMLIAVFSAGMIAFIVVVIDRGRSVPGETAGQEKFIGPLKRPDPKTTGRAIEEPKPGAASEVKVVEAQVTKTEQDAGEKLDEKTKARIQARYEQLMSVFKGEQIPPGELEKLKKDQMAFAKLSVLDPKKFREEMARQIAEEKLSRSAKEKISPEIVRDYLGKIQSLSPEYYALGAFLAADPTIINEGLARFPNDPNLLFSSLLYEGKFLQDPDGIKNLAALQPDSPWPSILGAVSAMKSSNPALAAAYLKHALTNEIHPYENAYSAAWNQMSSDPQLSTAERQRTTGEVLQTQSWELLNSVISGAKDYYKQNPHDQNAMDLAGGALALAERGSESPYLVSERVALMNELNLLKALGSENAERYLSVPYQELVDSLTERRENLRTQIDTVNSFVKGLSANDTQRFNNIVKVEGEWAAYQKMQAR